MLRLRSTSRICVRPRVVPFFKAPVRLYTTGNQRDFSKSLDDEQDTLKAITPELRDLLMDKSSSSADMEKYIRNMTPEELNTLVSSKAFQQHLSESKEVQQQYRGQDSEALGGSYPWSGDDYWGEEEEGEGGAGSWQNFNDYYRDDALREAMNTKFQDKSEGQKKSRMAQWSNERFSNWNSCSPDRARGTCYSGFERRFKKEAPIRCRET